MFIWSLFWCHYYSVYRWEEVLPVMSKGEKARITVPAALAYGDRGYPPIVPPNAKLIFEIELLSLSSSKYDEIVKRQD